MHITMYKLYNMYMMYTINEFRKNMRKAFEEVDKGEKVIIKKYDRSYTLESYGKPTAIVEEKQIIAEDRKLQKKEALKKAVEADEAIATIFAGVSTCPHGFAKGFCKKLDCNKKYGK